MKKGRRIALLGTAPSGAYAPFNDKSWEIWGVGCRMDYVTRADRWFELHRIDGHSPAWQEDWRKHLKEWCKDCEVWMLYPEDDLGLKVVPYPHQKIIARFGTFFLTSSFAWMLALALDEGVKEIGLWGVDMEYGTEYREQRTGLRHFIDLARVLGVTVKRLTTGGVSYEPVPYPMIQDDPLLQKLSFRDTEGKQKVAEWRDALERTEIMMAGHRAVINALSGDAPDVGTLKKELEGLEKVAYRLRYDIAWHDGANAERAWAKDYLKP